MEALSSKALDFARALPGLFFFFAFVILGATTNAFIGSPFPDVIIGMLLFLAFLIATLGVYKKVPQFIKNASDFFLPLLPLFILPSCIGILEHYDLVKEDAWIILCALTTGIVLTQIITPFVFLFALKIFNGEGK